MIQIKDKHDCCGCTACASVCSHKAITMRADSKGFLYPHVNDKLCVDCGLCKKACPFVRHVQTTEKDVVPKVLAVHHKDENVWWTSSSGGVFAALTDYVLNKDGVVFGAAYDESFIVRHKKASSQEGAIAFRGSKYVQSDMRGVYAEVKSNLKKGVLVLFSGTPCQVEGLKGFLMKPYDNLITVDILCHGVPSPMIFADYVHFIQKHSLYKLTRINMKDKSFGWGYQNLRLYFGNHGSQFNTSMSRLWNTIYYSHLAMRPSCFKCRFTDLHRSGDITIGDFWGIEKNHEDFTSDKGISLLLLNDPKGEDIWSHIKVLFDYFLSNTFECLQPALQHPVQEPEGYVAFWEDYRKQSFRQIIKKYFGIRMTALLKDNIRFHMSRIIRK